MKKPITEHLNDLPIEYREEALELFENSPFKVFAIHQIEDSQADALLSAFPFMEKKWIDRYNDLKSKGL